MALVMHAKSGVSELSRHLMRLTPVVSRDLSSSTNVHSGSSSWCFGAMSLLHDKPGTLLTLSPCFHQRPQSLIFGGVPVRYNFTKRTNYKETRRVYKDEEKDAIHCHGFSYYPRFPDHKDPPIEPAKLFMVRRVRSLYGCPWWEKKMMRRFNLEDRRSVGIFKNTPITNRELYKIKHLIEITPITTPYGLPDKPENGFLKDNGEFISYNPLALHGEDVTLEEEEKRYQDYYNKHINGITLKKRLSLRWYSRYDIV